MVQSNLESCEGWDEFSSFKNHVRCTHWLSENMFINFCVNLSSLLSMLMCNGQLVMNLPSGLKGQLLVILITQCCALECDPALKRERTLSVHSNTKSKSKYTQYIFILLRWSNKSVNKGFCTGVQWSVVLEVCTIQFHFVQLSFSYRLGYVAHSLKYLVCTEEEHRRHYSRWNYPVKNIILKFLDYF